MKVLVTGGTGFIGSRLVRALSAAGHSVRVVSRKSVSQQEMLTELIQIDLLDPSGQLEEAVAGCSIIFNCVGELHQENRMKSLHVDATDRLIKACKRWASVTREPLHWVQLSSVGAYGPIRRSLSGERIVTEQTEAAPVGTYEITKVQADELVAAAAEEGVFSYSIVRPSNVFGAGMPNDSLRQWGRLIKKRLFFYIGEPGAVSTYVHVDDVVAALMLCGFDDRAKGHIFNISNDCSQEQLVAAMAKALNVQAPWLRVPEWAMRFVVAAFSPVRGFPVSASRVDSLVARTRYPTDKLASVLGFRPRYEVADRIAEVFSEKAKRTDAEV
ncbi:NAD-dependent epimerase/dehydratase family protein [Stutzerimonas stutzeri]|uniref:NAD-dependent epimerase/dehydratase family protein n=1 Tax=Stutzerimonas stutzeri TaxID=316 RepID=UPI001F5A2A47|nr:NAD(P)-dependent oxidoreductase [Stutzerimonas stutzeri]UNM00450.1 NAD(P)-dependent oxidoreductase [Stutzerimonas stutzeri]